MPSQQQIRQDVTNRIIKALESDLLSLAKALDHFRRMLADQLMSSAVRTLQGRQSAVAGKCAPTNTDSHRNTGQRFGNGLTVAAR